MGKKTSKDPISEEEVGIYSSSETTGGRQQGAQGLGFVEGGKSPLAACAPIANSLP